MNSVYNQFQINTETIDIKSLIGTSTFRNLKLDQDAAIFSKLRINFCPTHPITHLVISNNHLVLAMSNKVLIRIDLLIPNEKEEIDLAKFTVKAKIHKIFLDPNGNHLLISTISREGNVPGDIIYIPWKNNKPKVSIRLKDNLITAIGWNFQNKLENSTGPILIGTSKGLVYEMEISSDEKLLQSGFERNFKQLMDISQNEDDPCINDLFFCIDSTDGLHLTVLCSLSEKLFLFSGFVKNLDERPLFVSLFNTYSNKNKICLKYDNASKMSKLHISLSSLSRTPISLALMAGHCYFWGDIDMNDHLQDFNEKFKYLPEQCLSLASVTDFVMTQFHILVIWPHNIMGICLLNNQVIFEDTVPDECGTLIGISKDMRRGTIWVYAEKGIFKYKIGKEDQNVWQIYLEQNNFPMAEKHCEKNSVALSIVKTKEAEELFKCKKYVLSAKLFSEIPSSFEEICLKFMNAKAEDALMCYLQKKLDNLATSDQNQVGLTVLVMWLLELYLKKLGSLRDIERRNSEEYREVDSQLKQFFRDPKVRQCVNQNTNAVYNLLASHDDQENYIGVALIMKDFNRVVLHLMEHQRHHEALEVMATQGSDKLFYQHISALLKVIPKLAVEALIAQGRRLDPLILLPTLIHAHASYGRSAEVLKYVEYCIEKLEVKDKGLHNFLVSIYCYQSSENLLPYLKLQGDDQNSINYDPKYALKECSIAGLDKASVHILTTIGLYQEAVELALKMDINIAKAIANRTKYNQELCKKLWLTIASHVVQEEQDVSKAMEILRECSLIKIEDILPFFPDFVTIDQFKDAICKSLQEYNEHIQDLKEEMDDATKTAFSIRNDIKKFKQKHCLVKAQDKCSECSFPLMTRSFYIFPCSHKFHQDCLSDAVMNFLSAAKQKIVSDLKGKLISLTSNEPRSAASKGSELWSEIEQIRSKIDLIVAAECLYCGEIAVNSVDLPFIPDEEWKTLVDEWK